MVNFENGQLVKGAYVLIDGVEYPVHEPEYTGNTPVSSENLNKLQSDLLEKILENATDVENMEITDTSKIIKYKNGLAIVCGEVSGISETEDFWGDFKRTKTISVTYPIAFTENPSLTISTHDAGATINYFLISILKTGFNCQGIKAKNCEATDYKFEYTAIGQWKRKEA